MIRTTGLLLAALLAGCAPAGSTVPAAEAPWAVDAVVRADIVAELNAARTDPAAYARKARALRALFNGDRIERPGEIALVTREGPAAGEQGRTGEVAHIGADGSSPSDRMRRQGRWTATGEAIAYGPDRAGEVILQLIVDDGVPDRGHRRILFNPAYTLVGAACAPHPVWRTVCVLDFARAG